MSVPDHAMKRFGRHIASLAFAAGIVLHVSAEARAQDICGLGDRVVEILSTIDACAATNSQLAELESVRQDILAPSDDTECGDLEERIAHLELTIPRLADRGPSTLEQPVPTCEANQEDRPAARPKGNEAPLSLEEAGIKNVGIYFGSWNEWARDPSLSPRKVCRIRPSTRGVRMLETIVAYAKTNQS